MTTEKIKQKAQKAQKILLDAVFEFFKNNPDEFFGARKITNKLGLVEGHNCYFVHGLLDELKKRKKLEQRKGSGFIYKRAKVK